MHFIIEYRVFFCSLVFRPALTRTEVFMIYIIFFIFVVIVFYIISSNANNKESEKNNQMNKKNPFPVLNNEEIINFNDELKLPINLYIIALTKKKHQDGFKQCDLLDISKGDRLILLNNKNKNKIDCEICVYSKNGLIGYIPKLIDRKLINYGLRYIDAKVIEIKKSSDIDTIKICLIDNIYKYSSIREGVLFPFYRKDELDAIRTRRNQLMDVYSNKFRDEIPVQLSENSIDILSKEIVFWKDPIDCTTIGNLMSSEVNYFSSPAFRLVIINDLKPKVFLYYGSMIIGEIKDAYADYIIESTDIGDNLFIMERGIMFFENKLNIALFTSAIGVAEYQNNAVPERFMEIGYNPSGKYLAALQKLLISTDSDDDFFFGIDDDGNYLVHDKRIYWGHGTGYTVYILTDYDFLIKYIPRHEWGKSKYKYYKKLDDSNNVKKKAIELYSKYMNDIVNEFFKKEIENKRFNTRGYPVIINYADGRIDEERLCNSTPLDLFFDSYFKYVDDCRNIKIKPVPYSEHFVNNEWNFVHDQLESLNNDW